MADPVVTEIADKTVVKAAEDVTSCDVIILDESKEYYVTYRVTGESAPDAPTNADYPRIPFSEEWVRFNNILEFRPSVSSDLYIYSIDESGNGVSGYVRVDA